MSPAEFEAGRHRLDFCKRVLAEHPEAGEITGEIHEAGRLPGLTNLVFRLTAERGSFILRVPRPETDCTINRTAEWHDLLAAADLGVTVRPLYGDLRTGILLLPEVIGKGRTSAASLGRCVALLHGSRVEFSRHRDPVAYLAECEIQALGSGPLPDPLQTLCGHLREGLAALAETPSVPCHFDLSPGNILPQGDELILIDFEYAAMANGAWDLAYAVLEHDFDEARESEFLRTYGDAGGRVPDPQELRVYKLNCEVISALWALAQSARGNDAENFVAFAGRRIARASSLLR